MEKQPNIVEALCADGVVYAIRPMQWNLEQIEVAWGKWQRFKVLSDDLPPTLEGFSLFVLANGSIWFEAIRLDTDEQVGLIYLNEFARSITHDRFTQALFHAVMWDARVGPRRILGRVFLKKVFEMFGFHRLQAEIPLKFGGAIRTMRRMGFQVEGTLRKARQYNGEWYNVLVLGILEDEVTVE